MNSSNQTYCSKKLVDQAQLFGDLRRQRKKLDLFAEDKFVGQVFKPTEISLPTHIPNLRSSYHQSYSACSSDGRYVASNQTDNKIYISDLVTSQVVNVLEGHSRGISSLTFHPYHSHLLVSGCTGGQVKIHDLSNNACQEWQSSTDFPHYQVVTSLSFHPFQDILAIAINNFVYFWFWKSGDKDSFVSTSTGDVKQKVRLIRFDSLGRLIIGISNDLHSIDSYQRLNNWFSNLTSNQTNSFSSSSNNSSSSNLNNLNNISLNNLSNLLDRHMRSNNAFRIVDDDYPPQSEILRSEALFNLTNSLTDSIALDHLLPENLPSYSFLQRNYQSENAPSSLFHRAMYFYRRLENEMNNELNSEISRGLSSRIRADSRMNSEMNSGVNIEMNNEESSNSSSESSDDRTNNSTTSNGMNSNDQELNVIMDSTNLVERLIRHRTTIQDSGNNNTSSGSNSSSESPTLNIYLNLSRTNRDYFLRRRLSSNRITFTNLIERVGNERTSSMATSDRPTIDRPISERRSNFSNTSEPSGTNQTTQRNLSDLMPQTQIQLMQLFHQSLQAQALFRDNHRNMPVEDSFSRSLRESINQQRSNSLTSNNIDTSRDSRPIAHSSRLQSTSTSILSNQTNDRITTQDNHNRFYTLLQHQASRRIRSVNNNSFSNPYSSSTTDQQQQPTELSTSQMSILISRIQSSINVINRACPQFENSEEMERLRTNSNTTLSRLIYYTNCRDKLIQLRNRIRAMLSEGNNTMERSRSDLTQLVWTLIAYTDQMQRKLVSDLRFTELSRLYRMRCSTNSAATNLISDLSESSNDSTSSYTSPSTSRIAEDDQPIPSTSSGITKSNVFKRKLSEQLLADDNSGKKANKKFKIPVVKISNDTDYMLDLDLNDGMASNQPVNSSGPTTEHNQTDNRVLVRTEMSSLLTNMGRLSELLSISQGRSNFSAASLFSSMNHSSSHRVNNPAFNSTNNQANNFPSFNVFIPANQWANYNEFNLQQIDNYSCRIHCFKFDKDKLPNLKIESASSLIVSKCKIQNDSSVDVSSNGQLLCCLVPSSDGMNLCVYSIKKSNLGQCLFIYCSFSSNAISVSFSPSAKYILVGLASRFYYSSSINEEPNQIAQIFVLSENLANAVKAKELNENAAVELLPLKTIQPFRNDDFFNLTSIKWLPTKDGLFYTNGQSLIIHRGNGELEPFYIKHMSNLTKLPSCILLSSISPRSSHE